MATLFTLREVADHICRVDGRSTEVAREAHQSLRYLFHEFGLLTPTDSAGPRGAWRFDEKERGRARLLHVLLEMGIARNLLDKVNAGLNAKPSRTESGYPSTYFDAAIADIKGDSPANWELRISVVREANTEKMTLIARVRYEGEVSPEIVPGVSAESFFDGKIGAVCAHVILPMTQLLKPLLSAASA